jgi:hypothetical protein
MRRPWPHWGRHWETQRDVSANIPSQEGDAKTTTEPYVPIKISIPYKVFNNNIIIIIIIIIIR